MANYSAKDVAFLLVGGYSLLGQTTEIAETISTNLENTTALGDSWPEFTAVGVSQAEITQDGFFDDATNSINDALVRMNGVSRVLCYGVEGNVIGRKFVGFSGTIQNKYERLASLNAVHRAKASHSGSGIVEEGVILAEHAVHGVDFDTSVTGQVYDSGAGSSAGGSGYLQVTGFSGPNSLVCTIRHSDSGSMGTFSDLLTFATVTGSQTAQRVTVSGSVKRYLCFKAFGFGNVSASVSATASISPSVSASASVSLSRSPSASISPSASTSLSPSSSRSPSASTSLSPSASVSPSASTSLSPSGSISPSASISLSASASPSAGAGPASEVTLMCGFKRN